MKKQAIILAAGEGTRMKSALPKVLHQAVGKPLVLHVIESARQSGVDHLMVVVGHGAEAVKEILPSGTASVLQEKQLGTGHAVQMAAHLIQPDALVLVLCGDAPLLRAETLEALAHYHAEKGNAATVLSAKLNQPFGYGRILRNHQQELLGIVEEKDATPAEKTIDEINSGTYCFSGEALLQVLPRLSNANSQQEYYLTDTLALLREAGHRVGVYCLEDAEEIMAVNSRSQLAQVEGIFRRRINEAHMAAGVTLLHPENTYIGPRVTIGRDTLIEPGVILEGSTVIGEACMIGQNSRLTDVTLGNRVQIHHSTLCQAFVDDETTVGPYAYLRPETRVGKRVRIGDFVEIKKSVIGDDSRAAHLAYIGDADVGRNVNIGCGVVFVNYDGRKKSRTTVEDDAFIGSNSNLVAPVVVEKGGYVAAGSTINQNVPADALAIARQRQRNIQGWNKRS